jgi:hypothetical protein
MNEKQFEITLPDHLYQQLLQVAQGQAQDISSIVLVALEYYLQSSDFRKTQSWKLAGAYTIAEQEAKYVVSSDDADQLMTNYAEHVDDELIADTEDKSFGKAKGSSPKRAEISGEDVTQLINQIISKLDSLSPQELLEILNFVNSVAAASQDMTATQIVFPSPEAIVACAGTWTFESHEYETIMHDIEQSRLMELEEDHGDLFD